MIDGRYQISEKDVAYFFATISKSALRPTQTPLQQITEDNATGAWIRFRFKVESRKESTHSPSHFWLRATVRWHCMTHGIRQWGGEGVTAVSAGLRKGGAQFRSLWWAPKNLSYKEKERKKRLTFWYMNVSYKIIWSQFESFVWYLTAYF
jgi:hypothetical protein